MAGSCDWRAIPMDDYGNAVVVVTLAFPHWVVLVVPSTLGEANR